MRRRALAFLMTLVLLVSMVPTSAFAEGNVGAGTAEAPYQIGDTVTNDGSAQPSGATVENSYWVRKDVFDTSAPICTKEVHDHTTTPCTQVPAAVECTLDGHPTEGELTTHTHEDGKVCTYDPQQAKWCSIGTGWSCGKEAHAHSEANGCYKLVHTVWTLTAVPASEDENAGETTGKTCEEGCILTGEEHDECFVWVACTKTEGCELADGHDGECTGITSYAGEAVSLSVSSSSYYGKYVVIYNATTNAEGVYYINSSGTVQNINGTAATFEAGSYTIYYGPVDSGGGRNGGANRSFYKSTVEIAEGATGRKSFSFTSSRYGTISTNPTVDQTRWATSVYYNTTSFTHIDVRVAGSYVININGTPYSATISNPSLQLKVNGSVVSTNATTSSTSYEWRLDETTVARSASIEVTLVVDLTYTDGDGKKHTLQDVTIVYDNVNDLDKFIEAVAVCNGIQGFDFIVDVQDIQEVLQYFTVTYEWRVYNTDGSYTTLPAGAPSVPGPDSGIEQNTEYVYNTSYVTGTSFSDYDNGLLYTFHGWDTYSHSSTFNVDVTAVGYTALDDGDTSASNNNKVPITADTYIYGYWTVTEMDPASAHIAVAKEFAGAILNDAGALAQAKKMYFQVDPGFDLDGDGVSRVDIDYSMITAANGEYKLPVYQYDIPFVITEHDADVPGYTRSTTIDVNGDYATGDATSGDTVNVTLNEVYTGSDVHLGTVTYTNTYTKNVGQPVSEYPELTLFKTATDTGISQNGVVFTLYSDAALTNAVGTYTTANGGFALIDFANNMAAGIYYLKETAAAENYIADPYVYQIELKAETPVEELRWNETAQKYEFVQVTYYSLSVTVPEDSTAVYTESRATNVNYRLHIMNEPVLGSLSLKKQVEGIADEDEAKVTATVYIHGPITRDGDTITDEGDTWTLTLNQSNNWTASLADLPLGEYLVHESFASVHGYTWTKVDYTDAQDAAFDTVTHNNITSALVKVTGANAVAVTLTNTYAEWNVADFYIHKVNESGAKLAGATFQLYTDEGCTSLATGTGITTSATTGVDGFAHFTGYKVPEGSEVVTYYLKETQAPAGYYLDGTVYKVEIKAYTNSENETHFEPKISVKSGSEWVEATNWNPNTDLLEVTNTSVKGQITVTKVMDVSNVTGENVPYGLDSIKINVSGNNYSQDFLLNDGNNWTVKIENLALGTYTITEFDADAPGYTFTTEYSVDNTTSSAHAVVTLTESNAGLNPSTVVVTGAAQISNTYTRIEEVYENPTTLTVQKVGEDGTTLLSGAEFTLEKLDANDNVTSSVTYTTGSNGTVTFDMLAGIVTNGDPIDGTYRLSETKAPEGYAKSETTWTVTVKEDNGELSEIKLNADKNIWESFWDWIVGAVTGQENNYSFSEDTATLTVKNYELADLTITKAFKDDQGNTVTPPAGAIMEIEVFGPDGKLYTNVELSSQNNWQKTIENIPAGKYTVTEATASLHGYTWNGMEVEGYTVKNNSVEVNVANSDEITLAVTNNYTAWQTADFWVFKAPDDGKTPLAGATFKLYSDAELKNEVTATYIDGSNTTDATGMIHFQGFKVDEGQTATFYLKETSAPYGYEENEKLYTVTIDHTTDAYDIAITFDATNDDQSHFNHGNDVLTVVNTEILGSLTIKKAVSGTELDFVRVDVTGPNGYSETIILTENEGWQETLTGLKLGEYTIKEQDASVPGYDLAVKYNGQSQDSVTVELVEVNDSAPTVEVTIENAYTVREEVKHNETSFTVLKVDENGESLAGAEFGLYDSDNKLVGQTQTTGDDGEVTFGPFKEAATYTLKEVTAPVNYKKIDTTWTVTVKEKDGIIEVKLNEDTNFFEHIYDWIVEIITGNGQWDGETLTLTVPNAKMTGSLVISKKVVYKYNGVEVQKPPQAVDADTEYVFDIDFSDDTLDTTVTLKDGESETIDNIPYGTTYTVTERTTGAVYVSEIQRAAGTLADTTDGVAIPITATNTYHYNTHNAGLNLVKVDDVSDAVIEGAGFTLYSDKACKNAVGAEVTTDEDGRATLPIPAAGTYYLKETTTPDGYHPNEKVYTITATIEYVVENAGTANAYTEEQMIIRANDLTGITEDGIDLVYVVENTAIKPVEVTVTKTWVNGEKDKKVTFPTSVKVALYKDGVKVETVTLNEANKWTYTWDDLTDEHEWTVDEPSVPSGYIKTIKTTSKETDSGDEYTYAITNTYNSNPKTGDSFGMGMWGLGMLVPVLALFVLLLGGNKKKGKYQA